MNIENKYLNEKTIDDIKGSDKIEKIRKINSKDNKLRLIFEWIKTGHISFKEFKIILEEIG